MSVTFGFFNSIDGDRKYNAEEMSKYFDGLVSDGIFENIGGKLYVEPAGGMNVKVNTGRALIDCHWLANDSDIVFTLDNSDVQLNRIDRIVVKLDYSQRTMSIELLKGISGTTFKAPEIKNTDNIKYLNLATIRILAGTTEISASEINNLGRKWVTGLDTGIIEQQYQAKFDAQMSKMSKWFEDSKNDFENWYNNLTSTLKVNLALQKSEFSHKTIEETAVIPLILGYRTGDVLIVHVNGVLLSNDIDYTIEDESLKLAKSVTADNTVTQILIQSTIDRDLKTSGDAIFSFTGNNEVIRGNMEVVE